MHCYHHNFITFLLGLTFKIFYEIVQKNKTFSFFFFKLHKFQIKKTFYKNRISLYALEACYTAEPLSVTEQTTIPQIASLGLYTSQLNMYA